MAKQSTRSTPEFKRQMVALVRAGRDPASLVKEFDLMAWAIALWVRQDGPEELTRLRRENRRLKEQRDILSKAAAWFARENDPSARSSRSPLCQCDLELLPTANCSLICTFCRTGVV